MEKMHPERQQGSLPSTPELNPKREGKKHYKTTTLRNGKIVERVVEVDKDANEEESAENPTQGSIESD